MSNQADRDSVASHCYPSIDERLDDIFDVIDDLLLAGEFRKVDTLLYAVRECEDFSFQIGVLTITAAARSKLPSRKDIFTRMNHWCVTNGRDIRVLDGLE
jgi:hypothetical protein